MADDESPRRTTLLVVMLGITFALMVIGVMVVSHLRSKQLAYRQNCGKNQSQIVGALVTYSTMEEVAWPTPWPHAAGRAAPKIANPHEARAVTCRAFEILAATQTLPSSMFRCILGRGSGNRITLKAAVDGRNGGRWGMGTEGVVMYAWDWASPADPASNRILIADRDPRAHGDNVMAAFADAHVKRLKHGVQPVHGAGALVTEDVEGKPIGVGVGNPEAGGEDIYSIDSDGGNPLTSEKGDPLRAWVK